MAWDRHGNGMLEMRGRDDGIEYCLESMEMR